MNTSYKENCKNVCCSANILIFLYKTSFLLNVPKPMILSPKGLQHSPMISVTYNRMCPIDDSLMGLVFHERHQFRRQPVVCNDCDCVLWETKLSHFLDMLPLPILQTASFDNHVVEWQLPNHYIPH